MPSRASAGLLLKAVVFVLAGCKESSDADRPLPAPEPPATATLTPPRDDLGVAKKRASVDDEPVKPKRASDDTAPKPPSGDQPAPETPTAPSATVQATGGAAGTTAPAASAPVLTAPSAACLARCQTALQGCLSQPVDGGVPGFGNLDLCKTAFAACQAACK